MKTWRWWGKFINSALVKGVEVSTPIQCDFLGRVGFYSISRIVGTHGDTFGYGVDPNPEHSQLKSLMEGLERLACGESGRKIWGSACHWNPIIARRTARLEVVERDGLVGWGKGSYGHQLQYLDEHLSIIRISSPYPGVDVALCASLDSPCVPFGTAARGSWEAAVDAAFNELMMSIVRHKVRGCGGDSLHDRLHLNTLSPEFRTRFLMSYETPELLPPKPFDFALESISGAHCWPLKVVAVIDAGATRWDPADFVAQNEAKSIFAG